ncbi:helix-turn-helix domain-containing protein [Burkholderia vietnamiensis]|uniref:helix-turn-helix domain-containing protein n=1 Tax=Burkholderia vietnamiensis TaxID=60552 RepID=UPI0012D8E672|nr:helix-turn-helix domain-containing protein [Burkholderia vietnamiensis]
MSSKYKCNILLGMNAQSIISALMAAGFTQMEIERRSGVDQSTVSGLYTGKRGKRVSYEVVRKLQALHSEVVEQKTEGP